MNSTLEPTGKSQSRWREVMRRSSLPIFAACLTLGLTLILSFNLVRGSQVAVSLNEPAPQDVIAPESITYVSAVLTEQAQQQAAAAVPDQFTPVDLRIARTQSNLARTLFNFIDVVRADGAADSQTRLAHLQAVNNPTVSLEVAQDLLGLSLTDFNKARDDVLRIIEETMREGVMADGLSEARRQATLAVSFDLTPAQERVVTSLAPQFIVPNVFFDAELTAALQDEARAGVEPVTQIVTKGERIIRVGDVVDESSIEMLNQLGLLRRTTDWRRLLSALLIAGLVTAVLTLYWRRYLREKYVHPRFLAILGILILVSAVMGKILVPAPNMFGLLYPAATLSLLVAVIYDARLAVLVTALMALLAGYMAQDSLEMAVYAAAGGMVAVLHLRDTQRLNTLFRAGVLVALGNMAVILIFNLPENVSPAELVTMLSFGLFNGAILVSGLSLAGLFVLGSLFSITTMLQLQELSRLDHPLLQELLRRAPGTYHHSIMVANLAEQAAEVVGANSAMVRVGAFYHDVGKMNRPPFFVENQNGANPHENLDPYSSARIIISHVSDGLELARKHSLPSRIRHFIAEHHGDRVLKVFYTKALEAAGEGEEVDVNRFRYKGPRPRSKETGIVQLADSVEATSTALRPNTEEAIEKLVTALVDDHLKEGQLDNSGLTLGDVKLIKESFIKTLKGRFHMRVTYPGNENLIPAEVQEQPAFRGRPGATPALDVDGTILVDKVKALVRR